MKKVIILLIVFATVIFCCGCIDAPNKKDENDGPPEVSHIKLSTVRPEMHDKFHASLIGRYGEVMDLSWSQVRWDMKPIGYAIIKEYDNPNAANIEITALRVSSPKKVFITATIKETGERFLAEFIIKKRTQPEKSSFSEEGQTYNIP